MRKLGCGRRALRKAINLSCTVRAPAGHARRQRIVDLSALGAWLRTSTPLAIGERIELSFSLDGAEHALRAEVMWAKPGRGGGMGVEFVASDATLLAQALASAPAHEGAKGRFAFSDHYR
jgi:hypothetical protein